MRLAFLSSCIALVSCAAPMGNPVTSTPGMEAEGAWSADDSQAYDRGIAPAASERLMDAGKPGAAESLPPDAPAVDRQVIYSAALRLVVVSMREAHLSVLAIARELGGHLQESDARSVTVRVPAAAFDPAVARIQLLGEVVDSTIRAADVTEELLDLGIRLENARRARERLLEHLARSEKVEDTLKIELELTRVTGEIERLEGRQRYLRSQVALSTIRVQFDSSQPQPTGDELDVPFEWIGRLGDGLVAGAVQGRPRPPRFLARGPRFDPPADFVRYFSDKHLVEAMNAEGLRIKVQAHANHDGGALGFWHTLARRALVRRRAVAVGEERELSGERSLLVGTREVGNQPLGYLLVLVRTKGDVHTFEAWGPREAFELARPALLESALSLRP